MATAKKNLHEKEQLLDQESQQKQAVTTKLKDLREEYNAMKAKYTAQEKANAETIKKLQQDVQQLSSKTKQMQEQLVAEREKSSQVFVELFKKLFFLLVNRTYQRILQIKTIYDIYLFYLFTPICFAKLLILISKLFFPF